MRTAGIRIALGMLLAGVLFVLGCGGPNSSSAPVRILCPEDVTVAEAIQAAESVLARMQFPIEKLDVEQGVIRTRPLRGAQFFELWRSDNASFYSWKEANLHSIRRSVEVRVKAWKRGSVEASERENIEASTHPRIHASTPPHGHTIECEVSVQRLSLPGNEVAGVSQAYLIHTASAPTLPRIAVTPPQQAAMAWIDLGPDRELAARILEWIEQRLERSN